MTLPKRPTKNPKPIGRHPHAGQYAVVVVSFRVAAPDDLDDPKAFPDDLEAWVRSRLRFHGTLRPPLDLDVAVRVLGVGGEASEHEGAAGPLAHTEDDIDTIRTTLDQDTINTRGKL